MSPLGMDGGISIITSGNLLYHLQARGGILLVLASTNQAFVIIEPRLIICHHIKVVSGFQSVINMKRVMQISTRHGLLCNKC